MFVFMAYYFSTHGCRVWLVFGGVAALEEPALVAAAAARALRLKKLDILYSPDIQREIFAKEQNE